MNLCNENFNLSSLNSGQRRNYYFIPLSIGLSSISIERFFFFLTCFIVD